MEKSPGLSAVVFPVFGELAASVQPGEGSVDDPAFVQDGEAVRRGSPCLVRSFHGLHCDVSADPSQAGLEAWSLIFSIGVELEEERIEAEQSGHDPDAAVTVLTSAPCTRACISTPLVSTRMWRLLPLIFLPASYPGGSIVAPLFPRR